METPSETALRRARCYFKKYPKRFATACRAVGLSYTSGRSALAPKANPTVRTVALLEKAIPSDFVLDDREAHEQQDPSGVDPSPSESEVPIP